MWPLHTENLHLRLFILLYVSIVLFIAEYFSIVWICTIVVFHTPVVLNIRIVSSFWVDISKLILKLTWNSKETRQAK